MSSPAPVVLTMVLPTFNEADNIAPLVQRLSEALREVPHELLVVDDRSPDGTAEIARRLAAGIPALRVIERPPPPGLTSSIRDGVEQARGRLVAWMDCDLSHPPELVTELLRPLAAGEADLAVASRYAPGGADARGLPFAQVYSRIINLLCQALIDSSVRDYTSGYVMGRRDTILELGLNGDYGEYCIELLGRAALRGLRVHEVGYAMVNRTAGESKTVASLPRFVARGARYLKTVARMVRLRLAGSQAASTGTPAR
jgi:dolichol-phosphate mannosyltransferase